MCNGPCDDAGKASHDGRRNTDDVLNCKATRGSKHTHVAGTANSPLAGQWLVALLMWCEQCDPLCTLPLVGGSMPRHSQGYPSFDSRSCSHGTLIATSDARVCGDETPEWLPYTGKYV
eukprot:gene13223-biopygen5009